MSSNFYQRRDMTEDFFKSPPPAPGGAPPQRGPPPPPPPQRVQQQLSHRSTATSSTRSAATSSAAPSFYKQSTPFEPSAPAPAPAPAAPALVTDPFQNTNTSHESGPFQSHPATTTTSSTHDPNSDWFTPSTPATSSSFTSTPHPPSQQPFQNTSQTTTSNTQSQQPPSQPTNELSGPMSSSSRTPSTTNYDPSDPYANEPPLLEELGINIPHIFAKSRVVILPFSRKSTLEDEHLMDDDDLAGPLAFALLLGGELLLTAKIHFGYIYSFGLFGCLAMALILNLMSPPQKGITVWSTISILGYSLLPVNALAAVNIFVRIKNWAMVGIVLAAITILWCTVSSTRLFERGFGLRDQRYLVAYPASLLYTSFVIITIF